MRLADLLASNGAVERTPPQRPTATAQVGLALLIMAIGMAISVYFFTSARKATDEIRRASSQRATRTYSAAAQQDAEQLLQRATRNDSAATRQIETRAANWRGRIQLTPQLTNLITAGFNANDLEVRAATVRLDLAAMNVAEDAASVDRVAAQADSPDHATRIWALWTLGLLANRGIATERITDILAGHLSDSDVETRRWAVEGLAYSGTDSAVPLLLKALHDDSSPAVRERAACSLAETGMFTADQRRTVIPTLLSYADDPTLDASTHAWTFHALRDITGQKFPDDEAQWKNWYEKNR